MVVLSVATTYIAFDQWRDKRKLKVEISRYKKASLSRLAASASRILTHMRDSKTLGSYDQLVMLAGILTITTEETLMIIGHDHIDNVLIDEMRSKVRSISNEIDLHSIRALSPTRIRAETSYLLEKFALIAEYVR